MKKLQLADTNDYIILSPNRKSLQEVTFLIIMSMRFKGREKSPYLAESSMIILLSLRSEKRNEM